MEESSLSRLETRVESAEAAELLCRIDALTYLRPFMRRECTVKDAALEAGVPLNVLHYWVGRLLSAGLVRIARVASRAGRPIKYYESTAGAYVVPPGLMPLVRFEGADLNEAHWRNRLWAGLRLAAPHLLHVDGIRVSLDEYGALNIQTMENVGSALDSRGHSTLVAVNTWSSALHLDAVDASELHDKLTALFEEYRALKGETRYVLHFGLAPWTGD